MATPTHFIMNSYTHHVILFYVRPFPSFPNCIHFANRVNRYILPCILDLCKLILTLPLASLLLWFLLSSMYLTPVFDEGPSTVTFLCLLMRGNRRTVKGRDAWVEVTTCTSLAAVVLNVCPSSGKSSSWKSRGSGDICCDNNRIIVFKAKNINNKGQGYHYQTGISNHHELYGVWIIFSLSYLSVPCKLPS